MNTGAPSTPKERKRGYVSCARLHRGLHQGLHQGYTKGYTKSIQLPIWLLYLNLYICVCCSLFAGESHTLLLCPTQLHLSHFSLLNWMRYMSVLKTLNFLFCLLVFPAPFFFFFFHSKDEKDRVREYSIILFLSSPLPLSLFPSPTEQKDAFSLEKERWPKGSR